MDMNGGVKVTYIETRFVTSDAAGFKDLVQRLTGRAVVVAPAAPEPPHRPTPCRPAAGGPQGCRSYTTAVAGSHGRDAPPCQLEQLIDMADFSDLFCYVGGGGERRRGPHNGGYNDFPY